MNNAKEASSPIYVIVGADRRAAADHIEQITDSVLGQADPALALSSYDGAEAELSTVLEELRTMPFLSPARLVVIKNADAFITDNRQQLEEYLEAPSTTGVLVLTVASFPKSTKLARRAAKIGKIISAEPLKRGQLPGYLRDYCKTEHNMNLTRDAALALVELAGQDCGVLTGEVDKIATYLADPQRKIETITIEHVTKVVGDNRDYDVFGVIDAMTAGNAGLALTRLDRMMTRDNQAQYKAVGAFAWHFRRLYNARLLMTEGTPDGAILKKARVWQGGPQFIKQVRTLNITQIGSFLTRLTAIDLSSKTGTGTVKTGLEKLVVQFCRRPGRVA